MLFEYCSYILDYCSTRLIHPFSESGYPHTKTDINSSSTHQPYI